MYPMKKVIFLVSILAIIASCKPNANSEAAKLSAMRQAVTDSIKQANTIAQQKKSIDSLKRVSAKSASTTVVDRQNVPVADHPVAVAEYPSKTQSKGTTKTKKKMNNTTKGAIIGASAGIVTGVITSKDKVKGGILGGVIGGAAGAGTGAVIDKKKRDKERQQQQ